MSKGRTTDGVPDRETENKSVVLRSSRVVEVPRVVHDPSHEHYT